MRQQRRRIVTAGVLGTRRETAPEKRRRHSYPDTQRRVWLVPSESRALKGDRSRERLRSQAREEVSREMVFQQHPNAPPQLQRVRDALGLNELTMTTALIARTPENLLPDQTHQPRPLEYPRDELAICRTQVPFGRAAVRRERSASMTHARTWDGRRRSGSIIRACYVYGRRARRRQPGRWLWHDVGTAQNWSLVPGDPDPAQRTRPVPPDERHRAGAAP
ncbi:uncharacterized protein LOC142819606 isoform X2 [Pelodiscus sinensis]|uniref:uncharacterized protein LOC142819606 isoform X2 n=1 Tax=Pelodiscus sinensis TaxID=13735 RepID=UPI003F6CEF79